MFESSSHVPVSDEGAQHEVDDPGDGDHGLGDGHDGALLPVQYLGFICHNPNSKSKGLGLGVTILSQSKSKSK